MSGRSHDPERAPARRNARDRPRRRSRPGRRARWPRPRSVRPETPDLLDRAGRSPLGHDPVHRDVPALGPDGLHPGQLVADADDDGLSRQAREGSVEEPHRRQGDSRLRPSHSSAPARRWDRRDRSPPAAGECRCRPASATPGCHSRKTSGCPGATTTGSMVTAPHARSLSNSEDPGRASCSPRIGQQKASFAAARPGNEHQRGASMRWPKSRRVAASSRSRAAISRPRSAFLQELTSAVRHAASRRLSVVITRTCFQATTTPRLGLQEPLCHGPRSSTGSSVR